MSRPGSNSRAPNPTPLTTPAAEQAPEELGLSSADALSRAGLDEGPPFGDWREQLRNRVKEIRARKLVDKRPIQSEAAESGQPADTARGEEHQTAHQHAAIMSNDTASSSPSDPAADSADLANLMDALLNPPEGLQPLIEPSTQGTQQGDDAPPERETDTTSPSLDDLPVGTPASAAAAGLTEPEPAAPEAWTMSEHDADLAQFDHDEGMADSPTAEQFLEAPVHDNSAPLFQETPATPPSEAVPLFQDEARLIDDNPFNEIDQEEPGAGTNEPQASRQTPPPLDGFRTETPGWAKIEGTIETTVPTTQPPPPPDLDAIPNELTDVDIPTWALPRQHNDQAAGAFAVNTPGQLNAAALLVGDPLEHASPAHDSVRSELKTAADEDRPSTTAASTTDPKASIEPEGLARRDVHIVGEYSAGKPLARRSSSNERPEKTTTPALENPSAPADLSTPHAEPRAAAVEPGSTPEQGVVASETPTWFEQHSDPAPESSRESRGAATETAEPEDNSPRRFPDLFDPAGTAPTETAALIGADDSPTELTPPQPATDTAMEWDLEAPSDADTILDAQRDPMDPTAPMSDRVFSALADALVLTTIAVLLMFGGASAAGTGVLPFVQAAPVPFAAAWLIFGLCYGIFFVGTCGQTLGKMAMRIRVIGSNRFRVGYGKATVRALGYAATMLPAGLGLLLALKDVEHRALHDRLSGTRVVKA